MITLSLNGLELEIQPYEVGTSLLESGFNIHTKIISF